MFSTDNLKALAKRNSTTVSALRTQARDLGLAVSYSKDRRTWFLDESATTVCMFNEFVSA